MAAGAGGAGGSSSNAAGGGGRGRFRSRHVPAHDQASAQHMGLPTHQLPLQARDLRSLDAAITATSEPFIAVRRFAVVFRIDPYRAIILRDRCLVILIPGMDSDLEAILRRLPLQPTEPDVGDMSVDTSQDTAGKESSEQLERKRRAHVAQGEPDRLLHTRHTGLSLDPAASLGLPPVLPARKPSVPHKPKAKAKATFIDPGVPFEFQAISLLFDATVERIMCQRHELEPAVNDVLRALRVARGHSVTLELERLRNLKNEASTMLSNLERLEGALDDVLEDDMELAYMQLTKLVEKPTTFWDRSVRWKGGNGRIREREETHPVPTREERSQTKLQRLRGIVYHLCKKKNSARGGRRRRNML